jgi:hypothetical protein
MDRCVEFLQVYYRILGKTHNSCERTLENTLLYGEESGIDLPSGEDSRKSASSGFEEQ